MKKKKIIIGGIILLLIMSSAIYNSYISYKDQKHIEFRVDVEQDAQVKNNEMMLSTSLTNIINSQQLENEKSNDNSKTYTNLKNQSEEQ